MTINTNRITFLEGETAKESPTEVTATTEKLEALSLGENAGEGDEKKKKKKNKSKSGKGSSKEQTVPPTIPVAELFPDGSYNFLIKFTFQKHSEG